jgi:hypothetical protein
VHFRFLRAVLALFGSSANDASGQSTRSQNIILQAAANAEGTKRWELVRRPDDLFTYSEDTYLDLGEDGGGVEGYWTRTHHGGLFNTSEAAKTNALETLLWLSEHAAPA